MKMPILRKVLDGRSFAGLIDTLRVVMKNITFTDNFKSQLIEIEIPAGEERSYSHYLNFAVQERIIVSQVGNGIITDVINPDKWNDKIFTLKNNGAVTVTAKVRIF